jgi:hypothetical protein
MGVMFHQGVQELIEVFPAFLAENVIVTRRCRDPATGAEPVSTPVDRQGPAAPGPVDEYLGELLMQVPAEAHLAGDAFERPVHNVHRLAALGTEHVNSNLLCGDTSKMAF